MPDKLSFRGIQLMPYWQFEVAENIQLCSLRTNSGTRMVSGTMISLGTGQAICSSIVVYAEHCPGSIAPIEHTEFGRL